MTNININRASRDPLANERPASGRVRLESKETSLDSLHEMNFDEDALRRAVKDLVHKFTEEKTLE